MFLSVSLPLTLVLWLSSCAESKIAEVDELPEAVETTPVAGVGEVPEVVESSPVIEPPIVEFDHEHKAWTAVLSKHVKGDRFNYKAVKEDQAALNDYLKTLHAVTPAELKGWKKEQRFAFWINVYNAHTIKKIVDNYPLDSIKDLSGAFGLKSVFDNEFITMKAHHPKGDDDKLSLNDVENGIIRERFKDARLHAAINCASFSCPPLLNGAFVASKLEKQLDVQMRAFVIDTKRNRFDKKKGEARISEIFKWFDKDFERDAKTVRAFLIRFAPEEDAEFLAKAKIRYIDYDWDLNDV